MNLVPFPLVGQYAGIAPSLVINVKTCRSTAIALGVEGRVGGDEVYGLAVHAAQNIKVVEFVCDVVRKI